MRGVIYAVLAYLLWGCFPLYFHYLSSVTPIHVLSYRIVFAFGFAGALLLLLGKGQVLLELLPQKKMLRWSLLASVLISINWYVFIWAVAQQRVLETSLGYFITPLVSLLLGRLVLKESVNRLQALAGLVAALAIGFELLSLGRVPWISLALAFSFGLYGLVRKLQPVESLPGLVLETLWMLPIALWFIGRDWLVSAEAINSSVLFLLIFSGVVTAVPLLLFAASVRTINLVVVGFIMYLNPLMQFVIAVWLLHEPVPDQRYITFVLVWLAMVLFISGLVQKSLVAKRELAQLAKV